LLAASIASAPHPVRAASISVTETGAVGDGRKLV
jgi:hypothetical protein